MSIKPISYIKLPLFATTKAYITGEHIYVEDISGVTDGHYTANESISAGSFDSTKWTYVDASHYVQTGVPSGADVSTVTLSSSGWSSNTQTVSVSGVTATSNVIVSPAPSSFSDYCSAVIYCSAQASGTLTFTCSTTPTVDISVNVMIVG